VIKRPWTTPRETLRDVDACCDRWRTEITSEYAHLVDDIPPGMNYSYYTEKLDHPDPRFEWRSKFSSYLRKADPDTPTRTITANPGAATGPFHWAGRRFTPVEVAVLQGFPPTVELPEMQGSARQQIGNAVPPPLGEAFGAMLRGEHPAVSVDDLPSAYRGRVMFDERQRKAHEYIRRQHGEGAISD
jgi:DNA (cytosine-5)-methyltransferase 1